MWKETVDLSDFFHSTDLDLQQIAGKIEQRFKKLKAYKIDRDIEYLLDDLKESRTVAGFDYTWNQIYNWADYNRVWIKTR